MKVEKKEIVKGEQEMIVEVPSDELKASIDRAVEAISKDVKIEGFRPGKATFEVLKQKIGELAILEEAARIYINKNLDKIINENFERQIVGQPQINITKLAPENPLEFKIVASLMPEVKLGSYKELGIKAEEVKVEEDEVNKLIDELREVRVKEVISESEVRESDKVIVDINMSLDNVPVEGGQAKDTAIIMGKGYVVPGFDKHLVGSKKGDNRKFELHFPEDHHQKNLAGKNVAFDVKIKEAYSRELPVLDDTFASGFGLKHVEELKENIKKTLEKEKEDKAKQKTEILMLDKIIDGSTFGDIPESVIKNEGEIMMNELEYNLKQQGATLENYLSSLGKTHAEIMLDMMPDAVKRVKSALIIREIAHVENIKVDEKEVDHEIEHILGHYKGNAEAEKRIKSHDYRHYIMNTMTNGKVLESLREWNIKK